MNICIKCSHCSREDPTGPWYNYHCKEPSRRRLQVVDPVTGRPSYATTNDLGLTFYGAEEFPVCRDVNKEGECVLWEKR